MKIDDPENILNEVSLICRYTNTLKAKIWITLVLSTALGVLLSYSWILKAIEGVEDKEHVSFFALLIFCTWATIYSIKYLPYTKKRIIVTKEFIRFGEEEISWDDLTKVRHSVFFQFLRIKTARTKFVFFPGLEGYDFIAALSKDKLKANQAVQTTSASARV